MIIVATSTSTPYKSRREKWDFFFFNVIFSSFSWLKSHTVLIKTAPLLVNAITLLNNQPSNQSIEKQILQQPTDMDLTPYYQKNTKHTKVGTYIPRMAPSFRILIQKNVDRTNSPTSILVENTVVKVIRRRQHGPCAATVYQPTAPRTELRYLYVLTDKHRGWYAWYERPGGVAGTTASQLADVRWFES